MSDHKQQGQKTAGKRAKKPRAQARVLRAGGGEPQSAGPIGLRGASALAIPTLGEYIASTEDIPPVSEDTTPIPDLPTPPSPPESEEDPPGLGEPIQEVHVRAAIRSANELRVPSAKNAGKDANGKVIPHFRSEEIAMAVAHHTAMGMPLNTLAVLLNLRPGQIKQHYRNELEHAKEIADSRVVSTAFDMATSGESEGMTKFWLQARKKWRTTDSGDDKTGSLFNIHIHN